MLFLQILGLVAFALAGSVPTPESSPNYHNKIILIRHGEKPTNSNKLSAKGKKRAQCFRSLFGRGGAHNIGLIISQDFQPGSAKHPGGQSRPYYTVLPLAKDLGLPVNHECDREDAECVRKVVEKFAKHSKKDVLICWKHSLLSKIASELSSSPKQIVKEYPDDRFDIMWLMKHKKLFSKQGENCAGLDEVRVPDPDLDLFGLDGAEEEGEDDWVDVDEDLVESEVEMESYLERTGQFLLE